MEDAEKSTKTIPSPKSYVDKDPGADSSEEDPVMDDDELHSLLGVWKAYSLQKFCACE